MSCSIKKRDGRVVEFDKEKIINAIRKSFIAVDGKFDEYAASKAEKIAEFIENRAEQTAENMLSVEEIQNLVEKGLMNTKRDDVARAYIIYRNDRTRARKNTIDKDLKEYLAGNSKYWNEENSNKDAKVVTTQRDYIAGITSTDYARRYLLPQDVVEAHDEGTIHVHDMDYLAQNAINNCCLTNLEDCLQNGTVINGVAIDRPHRLITATTIATQIITAVSSSQYGGNTITLTHLAPFVRMSYDRYLEKYRSRNCSEEDAVKWAKEDLKKEIEDSVQTFNYQINSMSTTNGQAPFLSVMMYLDEDPEYTEEVAMLIEEFLKQRIVGMKNEAGVYVTQEFPKLLYTLDEDNIYPESKYYYLTELAAKCTARRMVPDYISAKKMKEFKINPKTNQGEVYPCMGCRSFLTPDRIDGNIAKAKNYDPNKGKYYGRLTA